ncbi:MAG: adenylate kinase [Ruminococcaceae bacterium]|nr:adenylate kinase [Oscillospiraceae bacterium]
MKRVLVIGCPGSGKSTFSRALHKKTGLPLYPLDLLYWNADRTTVSREIFVERLQEVLAKDAWIIDGNYASTLALRLSACDTVFFFDLPLQDCLDGLAARKGKPRPDLPWIEPMDEEDEAFLSFVRNYRAATRPTVLALLERHPEKRTVIFTSHKESDHFFDML